MFDRYVAVDWSAAGRPTTGADSIWVAVADREGPVTTCNPPTRRAAEALVAGLLGEGRVLVGWDLCFGYPAGFGAALGLADPTWRGVWAHLAEVVTDDDANTTNRFAVAAGLNARLGGAQFWGVPGGRSLEGLPATRPTDAPLPEWRRVEAVMRARGQRPHACWKLAYAGAVGSQTLTGIPVLHRLRHAPHLVGRSAVWPFEAPAPVTHVEIWPSALEFADQPGSCRDERQVRAVVERWRTLGATGALADELAAVPDDPAVRTEEGWVLGVAP